MVDKEEIRRQNREEAFESLDEQIRHIETEFSVLSRAKASAVETICELIEKYYKKEILEVDEVASIEIQVNGDPESITTKTVHLKVTHDFEEERMTVTEWNRKTRKVKNEIREIALQDVEEPVFSLFVDILLQDVDFIESIDCPDCEEDITEENIETETKADGNKIFCCPECETTINNVKELNL